jgi:hypothetical protein
LHVPLRLGSHKQSAFRPLQERPARGCLTRVLLVLMCFTWHYDWGHTSGLHHVFHSWGAQAISNSSPSRATRQGLPDRRVAGAHVFHVALRLGPHKRSPSRFPQLGHTRGLQKHFCFLKIRKYFSAFSRATSQGLPDRRVRRLSGAGEYFVGARHLEPISSMLLLQVLHLQSPPLPCPNLDSTARGAKPLKTGGKGTG